jgi:heme exporter protein C
MVYLVLRSSIEGTQRRAAIAAVYCVIAFIDVPLVWLSARLLPDIHPGSIHLEPAMQLTLAAWFIPVTLMAAGLIVARFGLNRRESALVQDDELLTESNAPTAGLAGGMS